MDRLLEREGELEILAQAAGDAIGGRGSLVLVGGEAGIGKTSLLRALRAELGHRVAFLVGGCEPLSVPIPLAELRELAEVAGVSEPAEAELSDRLLLARNLVLRPLSPVAIRQLAEPAGVDPARLTRVTGGNPFLVVEAIAAGEQFPLSVPTRGARPRG